MPLWSSKDEANGAPLFAASQVNLTPNTANRNSLFGNTTADAFVTGQTVGLFGVDSNEIKVGAFYLSDVAANATGNAGSYVPGDILTLGTTGATISDPGTVKVTETKIRDANVVSGGSGYANGDTVKPSDGTSSEDVVLTVTTGESDDAIASLALTNAGSYSVNPTLDGATLVNVEVANTSANGATADLAMGVAVLEVANPGSYIVKTSNVTALGTSNGSGNGVTLEVTYGQTGDKGIPHTGWVKKTTGSGGRAGRVHYEVLVAGGIANDASDDSLLPDS